MIYRKIEKKGLNNMLIPEIGIARTGNFSAMYPALNWFICKERKFEAGRDGQIKELLDFKTQLLNPYRRCVGGYKRNANIFFLLAEAMWIATGKKDVNFLTMFNKKMSNFSDDGETFHAPYGYRLRHWGIRTEDQFLDSGLEASRGYDQVVDAIKLLSENPNTRQVVMSIWNPNFDLGYKTKDIPCNDIVMLKVRHGKLITTVQNRSNDLHWGLPTNIFQFSFLTELMASSMGIELGTQTHNSQSLHVYEWNKIAKTMFDIFNDEVDGKKVVGDMYVSFGAVERKIDFNFSHTVPINRFREIEYNLNSIINNLTRIGNGEEVVKDEIKQLEKFSTFLFSVYKLLKIYLGYKKTLALPCVKSEGDKNDIRLLSIKEIKAIEERLDKIGFVPNETWDIAMLAKNFFATRLGDNIKHEYLGKL